MSAVRREQKMRLSSSTISKDLLEGGWHSRDYLPHFDGAEVPQFLTFRLKDSLPQDLLERWRREAIDDVELRRRIETYLDDGRGVSYLRRPDVAALVQNSLLHYDGARYRLSAWVVMPNHVHLLATPCRGHSLSRIMHSLKSYTASEANKLLGRRGTFWMEEYYDRYIRDERHYVKTVAYIENNPVKAKLCRVPEEWAFSSARFHRCG